MNKTTIKFTYEQFEECIKSIMNQDKYFKNIKKLSNGKINLFNDDNISTRDVLFLTLVELMNDYETDYIGYYLYKSQDETFKDKNGNIVPINSIEELWNVLIENMEEK